MISLSGIDRWNGMMVVGWLDGWMDRWNEMKWNGMEWLWWVVW